MGTVKPQNNGPLYSNTVIGTLAADGWAGTFGIQDPSLSADDFRKKLKTHLFRNALGHLAH